MIKKKIAIGLSFILSASLFTACGGNSSTGQIDASGTAKGDPNVVEINYWNSGLGREFMDKTIEEFNKTNGKGYKADLTPESSALNVINTLSVGNQNTFDLYFTMLNTSMYDDHFIYLDDVLDSTLEGDSVTLREKYYDYLLDGIREQSGKTKFLNYGNSWCGLVYNTDYLSEEDVPLTTNELDDWCSDFMVDPPKYDGKNNVAPWIFYRASESNGYFNYVLSTWAAQYDGLDYRINKFFMLEDENGNSPSKEVIVKKDGRYKAIKVVESLLTPQSTHRDCGSPEFTTVQSNFLNGEAVFTVNGSWLIKESVKNESLRPQAEKMRMMKTPVISSIVETFEGEDKDMPDSRLSNIIRAIDSGKTYEEIKDQPGTKCSEKTFNRIKEARSYMFNNAAQQYVFIPKYSPAQEAAKEFLRFFYSKRGMEIFTECTGLPAMCKQPDYDMNKLTKWGRDQFKLCDEMTAVTNLKRVSPVFTKYQMNEFLGLSITQQLISLNERDRKNADQLWKQLEGTVELNWDDWVR